LTPLKVRQKREQPGADTKILCGINALSAIGLLEAGKALGSAKHGKEAESLVERILGSFWDGNRLAHCLSGGVLQEQSFLFDAAAVLAAVSMLAEGDPSWRGKMDELRVFALSFRDNDGWVESRPDDFHHVPATVFDHPIPSSRAMILYAIAMADLASDRKPGKTSFRQPFSADFFNVVAFLGG